LTVCKKYHGRISHSSISGHLLIMLSALAFCSCTTDKVTLNSLLEDITDREKLSFYPDNDYYLRQISTYNRESVRMNYALTAFYYVMPPFSVNIIPDIESVKHPVVFSKIEFTLDEK
jgi:hypothetical protein